MAGNIVVYFTMKRFLETLTTLLVVIVVWNACSCEHRQSVPEHASDIEQSAEQVISRAEQVTKALFEAYPSQIEEVEFRDNDWALLMRGTWYYYADGRLLPENLRENTAKYRSLIFYRYPAALPPWEEQNHDELLKNGNNRNRNSVNRDTLLRSTFMENLWQTSNYNEAYHNTRIIRFLGRSARVHHLMIEKLALVETCILDAAKNDPQIQTWINSILIAESFAWRNIAASQSRSYHSYGIALDLHPRSLGNRQTYWLWTSQQREDWCNVPYNKRYHPPESVISAFETYGFIWGGKWLHFDTMHFEYRPEVLILNDMPPKQSE